MLYTSPRKSYSITGSERIGDSLILTSERGLLRLTPQNEYIIRVNYTESDSFSDEYGLGISFRGSFSDWTFTDDGSRVTIRLPKMTAEICKKTSSITYYGPDGSILLREADFQSKYLCYYDTTQTVVDENTVV